MTKIKTFPDFCGRSASREDFELISEIVDSFGFPRAELARTVCELLDWTRPNGNLNGQQTWNRYRITCWTVLVSKQGLPELAAETMSFVRVLGKGSVYSFGDGGRNILAHLVKRSWRLMDLANQYSTQAFALERLMATQ